MKSLAHVWEDLRDGRLVAVMTDFPVTRTGAIWGRRAAGARDDAKGPRAG
ncbi:hypothetical protein V6L77_03060 [Pannonibacter sp. Pt2-lr]